MEVLRTRLCEWRYVAIDALALAPQGVSEPRLAVGRANGAVELWDTTTWQLHSSSPGFARRLIRGLVWIRADEGEKARLLSASLRAEITEWNLQTLAPLNSVPSGGGAVFAVSSSGFRLFAACDDGTLRVFTCKGSAGEVTYEARLNVSKLRLLSVAAYGAESVFVGGSDSRITKWSLSTRTCEAKMQVEKGAAGETLVWSLVSLADQELASGDSNGVVHVWDPVACVVLYRFVQHQADVLALAAVAGGHVLLSAGVDAKICTYFRQAQAEERWVFRNTEFSHKHDIKALAVDGQTGDFVSGGVTGKLHINRLKLFAAGHSEWPQGKAGRPFDLSAFSPSYQVASVAEDSRVVLCQHGPHLELWYMQPPKDQAPFEQSGVQIRPGSVRLAKDRLPEAQLMLRVSLSTAEEGQHLTASAITPDGRTFAASSASGTRVFNFSLEDLEVRRERNLPSEVSGLAARTMLFCGTGLLAIAAWSKPEILVLDVTRCSVAARFDRHSAPVTLLAASGEWLASADAAGAVHVFNMDSLQHHSQVPIGGDKRGFPTAMGFSSRGRRLVVVQSTHELAIIDVETQALVAGMPSHIPRKVLPEYERVCGVVSPREDRVLFWGHGYMLALDTTCKAAGGGNAFEKCFQKYDGMRYVLAVSSLDEARWGSPILKEYTLAEDDPKPTKRRKSSGAGAMLLVVHIPLDAAEKSLPPAFERKQYYRTG